MGSPMLDAARAEIGVRSRLPHVADLAVVPDGDAPLLVAAVVAATADREGRLRVTGG
jgi:hypothetical protein